VITREEAIKFIKSRSWYQCIDFEDDLKSGNASWCGEAAWTNIKQFLPPSLEGMRVLDLGCNAGLFCVRMALLGAKEVIGIDYIGWRPDWDGQAQQKFVKAYFEQKYNRVFPITYLSGRMEDILETQDLGRFDYTLGIASMYYSNRPDSVMKVLSKITDNLIMRIRDENRIKMLTSLCDKYGFVLKKVIQEKWWEKLNKPTDDFWLYLYSRC
jgi:2-polyprenyl-3-methyl-5-hydroxy-6-metoxy-1,4-benzoquinol methylase